MDYNKIGEFIISERKAKKLTQAKLAEKLCVSEKTVSKWENGNGVPDTESLPRLCEIFGVSLNELLNGERILKDKYMDKAEKKILELQEEKEVKDKWLLGLEIVIGALTTIFLISMVLIIPVLEIVEWLKIVIMVLVFAIAIVCFGFALKIEQIAGYYICRKCNHKYIPTYKQVNLAPHICRTRYMKCPKCNKSSWSKKVIK